ncbi:MAG: STAS domain-containing protein [Kineosporiaceae bacterium]
MLVRSTLQMGGRLAQISLQGALDARSAPGLRRVLDAAVTGGAAHVIVDLHRLEDVDGAVAAVLLDFTDLCEQQGGWLWLVHGADPPGCTLRRMDLHWRLASSPSREAAGWVEEPRRQHHPGNRLSRVAL